MKNFVKSLAKSLAIGAVWVFILSVPLRGQLLFDHAHGLLVENNFVSFLDQQANGAWEDLKVMVRSALADKEGDKGVQTF